LTSPKLPGFTLWVKSELAIKRTS